MSLISLDQVAKQIVLKQGLRANVDKTAASNMSVQGEPAYTTDTKTLWIHDGTIFNPVQTLDIAVTYDDEVVCNDGTVVYNI